MIVDTRFPKYSILCVLGTDYSHYEDDDVLPLQVIQSPTGGPVLTVRATSPNAVERSVRCGCHKPEVDHTTRKAVIQLIIASIIALVFMIGEVLGEGGEGAMGDR